MRSQLFVDYGPSMLPLGKAKKPAATAKPDPEWVPAERKDYYTRRNPDTGLPEMAHIDHMPAGAKIKGQRPPEDEPVVVVCTPSASAQKPEAKAEEVPSATDLHVAFEEAVKRNRAGTWRLYLSVGWSVYSCPPAERAAAIAAFNAIKAA